jgi:drug/metabolite transporter (DMT)-like permease
VGGISLSAPLIVGTAAPGLAIAFWRTAAAAIVLAAVMTATRAESSARRARISRRDGWCSALAGVCLAGHFGTWIPSLGLTTVAASTALVCTQPLWSAVLARLRGGRVPIGVWAGTVLTLTGVVLLGGNDLRVSGGAWRGDVLALAGGICGAAYVMLGERARRNMDAPRYNLIAFTAAAEVLGLVAAGSGAPLTGFSARAWLMIAMITVCGQLLGHGLLNQALKSLDATTVSTVALLEVPAATALAALFLQQYPPWTVLLSALLVATGSTLVVRRRRDLPHSGQEDHGSNYPRGNC